jgi:hypothetical protein
MNLRIAEPADVYRAHELARFFIEHVTPDYISYGEMISGRALDLHTWVPNLTEVLVEEFTSGRVQVWTGHEDDGTLVALGVVNVTEPVAVLENLVMAGEVSEYLRHLMACLRHQGHTGVRVESSTRNSGTHTFLEQMGFVPTHVHFLAVL